MFTQSDESNGGPRSAVRSNFRKQAITLIMLDESDRAVATAMTGFLGTLVDHQVRPRRPGIHNPSSGLLRGRRQPRHRGVEGPHNHPVRRLFNRSS